MFPSCALFFLEPIRCRNHGARAKWQPRLRACLEPASHHSWRGREDPKPVHFLPHPTPRTTVSFHARRKRWPWRIILIAMEVRLSWHEALISKETLQVPTLRFFNPPSPGNFVWSGNGIVFSGRNELIKDAACANHDNLPSTKILSLYGPLKSSLYRPGQTMLWQL